MDITAGPGVGEALERRRRGSQHGHRAFQLRPHQGEVTRLVGQTLVLLVGRIMFLVDDDQAQAAKRQKQRRPGPDDDARPAFRDLAPGPSPVLRPGAGMPQGRLDAEPFLEPSEHRLGEGDLGEHDQDLGLPVLPQRLGDSLEIDLGLARSRDPVQQGRLEAPGADQTAQHPGGLGLHGGQFQPAMIGIGFVIGRIDQPRLPDQRPGPGQPLDHRSRDARLAGELRGRGLADGTGGIEHALARFGHARRCARAEPIDGLRGRRFERIVRPQHRSQDDAWRLDEIAGQPVDEAARALGQGRTAGGAVDRLELAGRVVGLDGPYHAAGQPLAQGCEHVVARLHLHRLGHDIVEGLRQGQREQDGGDAA